MVQVEAEGVRIGLAHDGCEAELNRRGDRRHPSDTRDDHVRVAQLAGAQQCVIHQQIGGRTGVAVHRIGTPQPFRPLAFEVEGHRPFGEARIGPQPLDQMVDILPVDRVLREAPSRIELGTLSVKRHDCRPSCSLNVACGPHRTRCGNGILIKMYATDVCGGRKNDGISW
jgi:hypothetical protein